MLFSLTAVFGCQRPDPEADRVEPPVLVFVASSLGDFVERAARRFEATSGVEVRVNVGGSSTVGRQVLAGAKADVFMPADRGWGSTILDRAPRAVFAGDVAGNRLVLVGRPTDDGSIDLGAPDPPLNWSRLAIADPDHVPAGRYARRSMEALGWWDVLAPRVVPTNDVRAALRLVELGEANAGVVYATDVAASGSIEVLAKIPAELHEPIVYPVILLDDRPSVRAFVDSLWDPACREMLLHLGFTSGTRGEVDSP